MDQVVKAVQQAAGFVASQAQDAAGAIQHQADKVLGNVVKPPPPSRDAVPDQAPAGPAQLETEQGEEKPQQEQAQEQPTAAESVSKEDLGAREQGLMEQAKDKQLESHEITVPSHEKFHTGDNQPQSLQGLSGSTKDEAAAGGEQAPTQKQGGQQSSSSFEERTYKMTKGAETPAGTIEGLGVHGQGKETEGAPLSGRTQMFDKVPQGGGATTSEQDRPVKLSGHDYKHETAEQQQEGGQEGGQEAQVEQAQPAAPAATSEQQTSTMVGSVEGVELPVPLHDDEGDAAAGMIPHKGFEVDVSEESRGAETVDGSVKSLHLHTAQGAEGAGSKADQQLGELLNKGGAETTQASSETTQASSKTAQTGSETIAPEGGNAAPFSQEGGVMRSAGESEGGLPTGNSSGGGKLRRGAGDAIGAAAAARELGGGAEERNNVELPVRLHKEDGDAASGMVAHKESFEAEMARETRGAETVDGKVEDLGLHNAQGNEGAGSKADQQLGQFIKEGVQASGSAHATTAQEGDAPVKMMPHDREEQGMSTSSWEPKASSGGDATGSETKASETKASETKAAPSKAGGEQQEGGDLHPRVLQPEGIKKLAQAIAGEQQGDAALLPESERAREHEKNERMLAKAHEQGPPPPGPSVPGGDDRIGATAPSIGSQDTKSGSGAAALSGGAGTGAGSGATESASTDAARERAGTAGTGSPATETESSGKEETSSAAAGGKKESSSSSAAAAALEPELVDARNIGQFGGAPGGVADNKGGGFSTGPVSNPDTGFIGEASDGTTGRKPEPASSAQDMHSHRT